MKTIKGTINSMTNSVQKSISNPYLSQSVPDPGYYLFGAKSANYQHDVNQYENSVNAALWDAQLALMDDQRAYAEYVYEKYNTYPAQVKQMHQAGLNPDLQNISNNPMSAPQTTSPSGNVPSMVKDNSSIAFDFLTMLPQAVSMVTSLKGNILDMQDKKMDQALKGELLAKDDFARSITDSWFDNDGNILPDIKDNIVKYISSHHHFPSRKGKPSRYETSYFNTLTALAGSSKEYLNAMRYNQGKSAAESRKDFIDIVSSYGFNLDDETLSNCIRDFNEIYFDLQKSSASQEKAKIDAKVAPRLMQKGLKQMDNGQTLRGMINYIIGTILDNQLSISFKK